MGATDTAGNKRICVGVKGGDAAEPFKIIIPHKNTPPGRVTPLWMGSSAGFNGLTADKGNSEHVAQRGVG